MSDEWMPTLESRVRANDGRTYRVKQVQRDRLGYDVLCLPLDGGDARWIGSQNLSDPADEPTPADEALVMATALKYGWVVEETGGGCQALRKARPGGYWWITDQDGASIPARCADPVTLGCYETDGQARPLPGTATGVEGYEKHPNLEAAMLSALAHELVALARCYGCERVLRPGEGTWSRNGKYVLCGHRCPGSSPKIDPHLFDFLRRFVERETPAF